MVLFVAVVLYLFVYVHIDSLGIVSGANTFTTIDFGYSEGKSVYSIVIPNIVIDRELLIMPLCN